MIMTPAMMREVAKRLIEAANKCKYDDEPMAVNFEGIVNEIIKEYE